MNEDRPDLANNYGAQRQREIYLKGLSGDSTDIPLDYRKLKELAEDKMDNSAYGYVAGGAGSETTMNANRKMFSNWAIQPRMLRDVEERDLSVTVLDQDIPAPIMLAPVGVQSIIHPDGARASAEAADHCGVPFIHSTVASYTIEEISNLVRDEVPLWFQLYWSGEREVNRSFIERAEKNDYDALVVTVDTTLLGWRLRDLENSYLPFLEEEGLANYWSDPAFEELLGSPPDQNPMEAIQLFVEIFSEPGLTWSDIEWIRDVTDLPLIIKGLLHPDDIRKAESIDADGVVVSNHGGRQIDGEITALQALRRITREVDPDLELLFDSGIRNGSHVLKSLALGANAVLLGRPYLYGLALEGRSGVESVIKNIVAELDLNMGLSGTTEARDISEELVLSVDSNS